MGNQLAPHSAKHKQFDELQNACVETPLGGGRILRTLLYKHDVGKLVVKVFNKQGESLDLKPYKQQLKNIHERLKCIARPHVWPFQAFVETENTGFMIRPYILHNLYDRICSRPFLTHIEKCWVAYQLLEALVQCHSQGVCHGDIKSENALVTSWNWVFLADFASYKPTYMPADNPADFSYFFDIAGQRRCHVAPERFFEEKQKAQGELTPAMDVFSLGCVIAELFLDGKGLFDFSELHSYKKGQFDPMSRLAQVDSNVQEMILHMIQLDPKSRLTSSEYLTRFTPKIFPEYFSKALASFFGSLLYKDPDARIALLQHQFCHLEKQMQAGEVIEDMPLESSFARRASISFSGAKDLPHDSVSIEGKPCKTSELRDKELAEQLQNLEKRIKEVKETLTEINHASSSQDGSPVVLGESFSVRTQQGDEAQSSLTPSNQLIDGMILLLVLLCSQIRSAKLLETKHAAIFLLSKISERCTPECRLDRIVPYFLSILSDSAASIRALGLHHLLKLLSSVRLSDFQLNFERRLYKDYILPCLSLLPTDPEEIVRVEYAAGIPELTLCAYNYLQKEISSKKEQGSSVNQKEEKALRNLRDIVDKEIQELISGENHTSKTRQALAQSSSKLAKFYGIKKMPDLLLLLTTCLNDPDWQMRVTVFDCVRSIEETLPIRSLQILKPYLETGLQDKDPAIVVACLSLVTHLCQCLHPRKEIVLGLAKLATPLLVHSSIAVRAKTIRFLRIISQVLPAADAFARLLPMTKGHLPQDPFILESEQLIVESLTIQETSRETGSLTPHSHKSTAKSEYSTGSRFDGEDDRKEAKMTTYSTRVDCSLYQRGLTRHEASLERASRNTSLVNRFELNCLQDVRSKSSVLNYELSRTSVKHGTRDGIGTTDIASSGANASLSNAMADAMTTKMTESPFLTQGMNGWRPEGVLLAHYAEHRRSVNQIAVSADPVNPFFVTASSDGTVKVWDLKLVDDDLRFASCATYAAQKGEVLSVSVCEDGKSVASASRCGTLHLWRLNYSYTNNDRTTGATSSTIEQFSGVSNRQEVAPEEGAILSVHQWGSLLLYTTQKGVIHAWDIRMRDDAWQIKTNPREGLICSLATDPLNGGTWLVTGSSQGSLALWDVRFKLQVKNWVHPSTNAILNMAPSKCALDQMKSMGIKSPGPFVYVVCGGVGNEVGLWDVQEGACKQVFRAIPREETEVKKMELPAALAPKKEGGEGASTDIAAEMEARHQKLRLSHSPNEGIRCVIPIACGSIITGGYDKYIRVWDGVDPKRSFPMSGSCPMNGREQGMYNFQYSRHSEKGVSIINECCLKSHYHQAPNEVFSRKPNSGHDDCVTDLSIARVRETLLISASRDGVVKIWK